MNITKGIDRIALVIAIITIIPGFILGRYITYEEFKTITPEYKKWEKKYNDRGRYLYQKNKKTRMFYSGSLELLRDYPDDIVLKNIWLKRPPKYQYLPQWKRITGSIVAALISFIVVLFGIRGLTRGIKWFSLWIVEGFKDEKSSTK